MRKQRRIIMLLGVAALIASCSSVDFYEVDENGKQNNVGFLYYPPKPYLLIEAKDGSMVRSVISLPDLSKPHRIRQRKGWGTAELGFTIDNGMISTFNSKTDAKGPEALTSIAGLGTAEAALITAKAAEIVAEASTGGDDDKAGFVLGSKEKFPIDYKVDSFVKSVAILKGEVLPILANGASNFEYEIQLINEVVSFLESSSMIDYDPLKPDDFINEIEKRRKPAKQQANILKNVSTTLTIYENNGAEKPALILIAKSANDGIKPVIKMLNNFSLRNASIAGLYEISYINGKLNLSKVLID